MSSARAVLKREKKDDPVNFHVENIEREVTFNQSIKFSRKVPQRSCFERKDDIAVAIKEELDETIDNQHK